MLEEQAPYRDVADGVVTPLASVEDVVMALHQVTAAPMLVWTAAVNQLVLVLAIRVDCAAYRAAGLSGSASVCLRTPCAVSTASVPLNQEEISFVDPYPSEASHLNLAHQQMGTCWDVGIAHLLDTSGAESFQDVACSPLGCPLRDLEAFRLAG